MNQALWSAVHGRNGTNALGTLSPVKGRGRLVLAGVAVAALLGVGVANVPLPYVVLQPGPTVDTLGVHEGTEVIKVDGTSASTSAGQLRMTTVNVRSGARLGEMVQSWFADDQALVPREVVYPPGQTDQQVQQRNAAEFAKSQTSAETAALRALGYPVQVTVAGTPVAPLRAGDVVTSVDGTPVTGAAHVAELVKGKTTVRVAYSRAGAAGTGSVAPKDLRVEDRQPHPFTLAIKLDEIGGPSAGLMFALGIIDKLRPDDLTGGRVIAGTGTIDGYGVVGPIGGIPQKLRGAKSAGAAYFLVPAGNCTEALRNAVPGLTMAKVGTLDDGLSALKVIRAGGSPTPCIP